MLKNEIEDFKKKILFFFFSNLNKNVYESVKLYSTIINYIFVPKWKEAL